MNRKTNNETNKQEQNISLDKKMFSEHSALKGLPTNAMTKNPIFHNLNKMEKQGIYQVKYNEVIKMESPVINCSPISRNKKN